MSKRKGMHFMLRLDEDTAEAVDVERSATERDASAEVSRAALIRALLMEAIESRRERRAAR